MAVETAIDTVQGLIAGGPWFHLDTQNDVLYLRKPELKEVQTLGEETPEGFTRLETANGQIAGYTVVSYWRDYGHGPIEDASINEIKASISSWTTIYFQQN